MPTRSVGTINSIREQARSHRQDVRSAKLPASTLAPSRLKPVPLKATGAVSGAVFPAKAAPTKKHTAYTLWDRLQPGSC